MLLLLVGYLRQILVPSQPPSSISRMHILGNVYPPTPASCLSNTSPEELLGSWHFPKFGSSPKIWTIDDYTNMLETHLQECWCPFEQPWVSFSLELMVLAFFVPLPAVHKVTDDITFFNVPLLLPQSCPLFSDYEYAQLSNCILPGDHLLWKTSCFQPLSGMNL